MSKKGFQEGEWEFTFPNEDKYSGQYCAHVSGLAWRQGHGIYTTHEGQIYEGNWKDDRLNEAENLQIIYQNTDQYNGKIQKYKYNGPGTYTFNNGCKLTCIFSSNKPSGDVILVDHHDQLWYGKSEAESCLLSKEHIFSYELDSERGKGRPLFKPPKIKETTDEEEKKEVEFEPYDQKDLEQEVFAKSTKTESNIDFEDSDWYRDFQRFKETRKTVLNKLATYGPSSLSDEEKVWYKHYWKSAKILHDKKKKKMKTVKHDLLRHHFDEELKDTCPPTRIFYGSLLWGQQSFEG